MRVVLALMALLAATRLDAQRAAQPEPPVAAVAVELDTVAGVEWRDPYAWLRDDTRRRPEVLAYLRQENAYTETMTRHTRGL